MSKLLSADTYLVAKGTSDFIVSTLNDIHLTLHLNIAKDENGQENCRSYFAHLSNPFTNISKLLSEIVQYMDFCHKLSRNLTEHLVRTLYFKINNEEGCQEAYKEFMLKDLQELASYGDERPQLSRRCTIPSLREDINKQFGHRFPEFQEIIDALHDLDKRINEDLGVVEDE